MRHSTIPDDLLDSMVLAALPGPDAREGMVTTTLADVLHISREQLLPTVERLHATGRIEPRCGWVRLERTPLDDARARVSSYLDATEGTTDLIHASGADGLRASDLRLILEAARGR